MELGPTTAAQMWLQHPREGHGTKGPHGGTAKFPGEEVQGWPATPELAMQRGVEDVCRKEKLEKAEGERGRKLGRTDSSSSQLENFPSATTGCDTGPRSYSLFLGHI